MNEQTEARLNSAHQAYLSKIRSLDKEWLARCINDEFYEKAKAAALSAYQSILEDITDERGAPERTPPTKELVLGFVKDCVVDLMYYDRKECEDCPRGEIEKMFKAHKISIDEMVNTFREELTQVFIDDE